MDEEKRSNQNYEIIESCTIGSTELVIGHNPNSPNPYVCWYCKGGSNYFWGYYTNELDAARQKLNERPYPRYKDGSVIFCDVCIRKILDEQKEKKERKEQPNE